MGGQEGSRASPLTRDARQLEDPSEKEAIKKSGMHHIRFSQAIRGMAGLGLAMGAVVAAMPLIAVELDEADTQQLIHIKGLNPVSKHRFEPLKAARRVTRGNERDRTDLVHGLGYRRRLAGACASTCSGRRIESATGRRFRHE